MCVLEVLHFLPLGLIALSVLSLKGKFNGLFSLSVAILSIVGLLAGNHAHVEHGEFFGLIDPCSVYLVSLAISSFALVKSLKVRFANINA